MIGTRVKAGGEVRTMRRRARRPHPRVPLPAYAIFLPTANAQRRPELSGDFQKDSRKADCFLSLMTELSYEQNSGQQNRHREIRSAPPMKGRNAGGMTTDPSRC